MPVTTVYTDGACRGNPGPGGWAWAIPGGQFASGAEREATNQRMEVTAVLEALSSIDGPVEVVSDSTYVVHCFRDRWWQGWERRRWRNSKGEPVANQDLWRPLIEIVKERNGYGQSALGSPVVSGSPAEGKAAVTFRWVKGHAKDGMNELVDRLATEAADSQQGRQGTGMPW